MADFNQKKLLERAYAVSLKEMLNKHLEPNICDFEYLESQHCVSFTYSDNKNHETLININFNTKRASFVTSLKSNVIENNKGKIMITVILLSCTDNGVRDDVNKICSMYQTIDELIAQY